MTISQNTAPHRSIIPITDRMMRANRAHARGGPEQLVYEEAPIPTLAAGDALIAVRAVGVTPHEFSWNIWERPDGTSRIPITPGHEVAGVVVAVAPNVIEPTVGAEVYALVAFDRDGAAAEYAAVPATDLASKPHSLTFPQAAAIPLSALTAWQALITHGQLRPDQRVLIHGAAGGVGTFAVQIARLRGAHVIGSASGRDADFLTELGCDEVIDYQRERFEEVAGEVDVVFDTVGRDTTARSWAILRPGGVLVTIAPQQSPEWATGREARGIFFVVKPDRAQLRELASLIDDGAIKPIVEAVLPLERAREAYERGLRDHPRGKLVLSVGEKG